MRLWGVGLICVVMLSCAGCAGFSIQARGGPSTTPSGGSHGAAVPPEYLGIPRGHLPPPGECRVWHPGEGAGLEPAPGKCEDVSYDLGPGDWLLYRPSTDEEIVEVTVHDPRTAGVRIAVWVYDFASGRYLRDR